MLMVAPERETPGTMAQAWARPMSRASRVDDPERLAPSVGRTVGDEEDDPHEQHARGHDGGRAEDGVGPLLEQQARDHPGHGGGGEEPKQPTLRVAEGPASAQAVDSGADELPPVRGEGEDHGGQGPEVKGHVEGQAVLGPAEQPGHDDEVARAADGQELAQALHDSENDRLEQAHRFRHDALTRANAVRYPHSFALLPAHLRVSSMGCFASVNGTVVPAEEARVSVLDNGFTFGDAVYETLRTYHGRPFELPRHLARLRASAARLGFAIPPDDAELGRQLGTLLGRAGNSESYIRLIVSRGVGDISYHFDRVKGPTIVMVVKPLEPFPEAAYREGIDVAVVDIRRNHPSALDPAIKSCNLLNNILAVREAQAPGRRRSPAPERARRAGRGREHQRVRGEGRRPPDSPPRRRDPRGHHPRRALRPREGPGAPPARGARARSRPCVAADEVFVTSSTREAMPVRAVDGRPVGDGRPGPVTRQVMAAFRAYADEGRA